MVNESGVPKRLSDVQTTSNAVKAKTDNLPAAPAAQAKLDTLHDTRIPGVVQPQTGDSFARLGAPAGASVSDDVAAVKAETNSILGSVGATTGPTSGTFSLLSNTNYQDVITVTGITKPTRVVVALDFVNAAQTKHIVTQEKIDGTTYREVYDKLEWLASASEKGIRIEFTAQNDYKISVKNVIAEAISVPFRHSRVG